MTGRSLMNAPVTLFRAQEANRSPGISLDLQTRKPGYAHCEGCRTYAYAGGKVSKGWRCACCRSAQ